MSEAESHQETREAWEKHFHQHSRPHSLWHDRDFGKNKFQSRLLEELEKRKAEYSKIHLFDNSSVPFKYEEVTEIIHLVKTLKL